MIRQLLLPALAAAILLSAACGDTPQVDIAASTATNTPLPTDTPTVTPTPLPTDTPTVTPTPLPTNTPTVTPSPTNTPTVTPTPLPTNTPTVTPTPLPTNTPTATPTPFVGEWERVRESADVLTGKEVIGIALRSDASRQVALLVRCTFNSAVERENGLEAFINWDDDLGSDYQPTVAVRFDDGDIQGDDWGLSTNSEATFAPDADAFISSMKGASHLVARVWKQDQTTITAQWQVAGFRDAVQPVEWRCDPNFVPSPTPTATPTPITISDYLWRYETGGPVGSSPAVVDGVVYFGSVDNYLYAVDAATGTLRWQYETGDNVTSSPAVIDGVVYVGSWDGYVYAVDTTSGDLIRRYGGVADGAPLWYARGAPLAVEEGVVYYGNNVNLLAVDADTGDLIWRTEVYVGGSSFGVGDGVLYFRSLGDYLYAVDAVSGELLWRYETGDSVHSSPAVVDGVVYVGSGDSYLYAVDAVSGELRWRYETGDSVHSSPAVVDGVVYVGSWDRYLYAVDAVSGELRWRYETGHPVSSSPAVVDGVVYFGSDDGYLYAVDAVSGELLWRYETGGSVYSSPSVVDGVVYFGSRDARDGYLYAVDARGR